MRACAFVLGDGDGEQAGLARYAKTLGFWHVESFAGPEQAEAQLRLTPICFFLFAPVADLHSMRPKASLIRAAKSRRLQFSPLVYFSDDNSTATQRLCRNMGFDEVIAPPFSPGRVHHRLKGLVDRPVSFFETESYFGPDRRGGDDTSPGSIDRRGLAGLSRFRSLEIVRDLSHGVLVLRDQLHNAA